MGVMACDRAGCSNIMCDRYSHRHGYICNECFSELVSVDPPSVSEFMDTAKEDMHGSDAKVDYDAIFPMPDVGHLK